MAAVDKRIGKLLEKNMVSRLSDRVVNDLCAMERAPLDTTSIDEEETSVEKGDGTCSCPSYLPSPSYVEEPTNMSSECSAEPDSGNSPQ